MRAQTSPRLRRREEKETQKEQVPHKNQTTNLPAHTSVLPKEKPTEFQEKCPKPYTLNGFKAAT